MENVFLYTCNICKHHGVPPGMEPCASCSVLETGEGYKPSNWEADKKEENNMEAINHPNHYNREGAIECIDEMVMIFGRRTVMDFCMCNAWKYRYRAADKNGEEDLKKSDWYMMKYKELLDESNEQRIFERRRY